jgi:multisubunit Na+/H+ antiporter MnhB subunit
VISALFLDGFIVFALLWVAWRVLASPSLFDAVVLFIVFGLVMSLAWVRLNAPDIALAEAAIGAGLTGVLLLDALDHLAENRADTMAHRRKARPGVALIASMLTVALGWSVVNLPVGGTDLAAYVESNLARSGVSHAVTAVLLNFRGYDTFLEVGVLLVAMLGVLAVRGDSPADALPRQSPVLQAFIGVIGPLVILVAGYLLWAGTHQPGGAFQAGAVLAAGGLLLYLGGVVRPLSSPPAPWRVALAFGFATTLAVMFALLPTHALLQLPPDAAHALIVFIEVGYALSIALILLTLFVAAPPRPRT